MVFCQEMLPGILENAAVNPLYSNAIRLRYFNLSIHRSKPDNFTSLKFIEDCTQTDTVTFFWPCTPEISGKKPISLA